MSVVDGKKGGKQSRFSSLRVFGKLGRNAPPVPPPPPPKDAGYLAARNRSLASLSPDSMPASPLAGDQYAASSSSAVSLALPQQPKQRSGPADEDENISMPWNFQHNVHVDEGFTGLPPSWTTSLQEAGFSDDEIAAIQQRRLADRPRQDRDRATSPAAVVRPVPRSTSLPKNQQGGHTPASSLSASSASASVSSTSSSPVPDLPYSSPKMEYTSPKMDYSSQKTDYAKMDSKDNLRPPPSPKSPPPVYWRDEQPQPLNVPRRQPQPQPQPSSRSSITRRLAAVSIPLALAPALTLLISLAATAARLVPCVVHSRSQSQQSQQSDFDDDPRDSRSRSPSPVRAPATMNMKNLTLDLDLSLGDPVGAWSDAVLSATPWSASLKPDFGADAKGVTSPSSPLFTLTAPGHAETALGDEEEYSPTAASPGSTGSGSPRLAYDYDYGYDDREDDADDRDDGDGDRLGVSREKDNRDSGMSDSTMLAPPPSAGVVSRIAVARRAVAEVVGVPAPRIAPPPVPTRPLPPASPQSSHFGSSGSSESQDHQTPTTEVAEDEEDNGELDYYLEGKNYLENNGFRLEGTHRERGHGADHGSAHGHSRSNSRKNTAEDMEDEEDRRQREWEAMQRGEVSRTETKTKARTETRPTPTSTPPLQIKVGTPPLQSRKPSPIQTTSTRPSPPTQTQVRTPTPPTQQPDPRARLMVSATDTFGHANHEQDEEEEGGVRLWSPNPGVGTPGYGSAFGSPSAAPGYGYGGRSSKEPRREEEQEQDEEDEEEDEDEDEEGTLGPKQRAALGLAIRDADPTRPQVITARRPVLSPGPLTAMGLAATPITPAQRYAGWVAAAVAPLEDFIDEPTDPREFYDDLQEIAEGESGSVYAATLLPDAPIHKLRLPPLVKARDADALSKGQQVLVAIKFVALLPGGSQKLVDVQRECALLRGLRCEQLLGLDALYVDMEEDSLWIRMDLMERSLADVVGLVDEGLRLQEPRIVARFANDISCKSTISPTATCALTTCCSTAKGILKLADFSNAVGVTPESPLATDVVGVVYWQAPEVRSGSYDPLKIDVWSVGATVWEIAEANPPFSDTQQPADRWPPLSEPALYPPSFHDFLRLCSEPAASRPTPKALLETPFVQKACGRPVIVQLLSRCTAIRAGATCWRHAPLAPVIITDDFRFLTAISWFPHLLAYPDRINSSFIY
ncbi:hypothetical protein B0H14DRAFT_3608806 [Mycena olivaceomarginata]|nr:hypothetical protein B0H14DRAFT_3608806 [Mycena olivaceomarginata]